MSSSNSAVEARIFEGAELRDKKLVARLKDYATGSRVLIAFWRGMGDVLMFSPVFEHLRKCCPEYKFTLSVIPGIGFTELVPGAIDIPKENFLDEHDVAFVLDFPMTEGGASDMTKADYCCEVELGIPVLGGGFPKIASLKNTLVGVHLQGTCLPGSTNPDRDLCKQIWDDILDVGGFPIDLHFQHVFHNPVNEPFEWAELNCRKCVPKVRTLQLLIERCAAFVGVASGPWVFAHSINPKNTIYLQKGHGLSCYLSNTHGVKSVDLNKYDSESFKKTLQKILKK